MRKYNEYTSAQSRRIMRGLPVGSRGQEPMPQEVLDKIHALISAKAEKKRLNKLNNTTKDNK